MLSNMINTNKLMSLYNKPPNLPARQMVSHFASCNGKNHKLIGNKWKNCNTKLTKTQRVSKSAIGRKNKPIRSKPH